MIALPVGSRVWLAARITDLRKGFDGLVALVQTVLDEDPSQPTCFAPAAGAGVA
jgi:transposase